MSKTKIAALVAMFAFTSAPPALAYPTQTGFNCQQEQNGLFSAAREGKTKVLQLYLDNKCPFNLNDGRGFNLYDIAALSGNKDVMQWLIHHNAVKEGQYSPALYKLLQTGLRFLNHDAGVVDGKMNAATADGIKSFQKSIHQNPTGRVDSLWLAVFNNQLTKKMQVKLSELGFKAGKPDGIIGAGTRSAMQAFRQERKMPKGEYAYIDDQLIYQLMMAENEANKKAIARREAEQAARQIAQQAAQRQEEARKRAEMQRRATEKRQQAEAIAAAAEAQRQAAEKRRQAEIAAAAAKAQADKNPHAVDDAATEAIVAQHQNTITEVRRVIPNPPAENKPATPAPAPNASNPDNTVQAGVLAAQLAAAQKAAQQHEQELAVKKAQAAAEKARQAEALARKQAEEAAQAAEKARSEARSAFKAVETGKPFFALNSSKNLPPDSAANQNNKTTETIGQKTRTPGFQKVVGALQLQGRGRQLISCSVGGKSLDIGWCHQYYPSGNGKKCQAVISNTGIVVSLTCK